MQTATIIWDFDGTLLPLAPYDSEQTLMMYKLNNSPVRPPYAIRVIASLLIWSDRRQVLRKTFKRFYIRLMKGTPAAVMDQIGERLSDRISLITFNTRSISSSVFLRPSVSRTAQ